jgi:Rieske 2Fe-2S family protein
MRAEDDTADRVEYIKGLAATRRAGHGLPRCFYHARALYEHEMDAIWRSGWIFAGHACEIPQAGDFVTITLDGDPVLIIRDDAGQVRAFHNICTHRGTVLFAEPAGYARAIVCPYHQWTFSRRGELLKCAGMQQDIDKGQLGLRAVRVEVCEGLIFISLAETPPAFAPAAHLMGPFARPQGFERARVAATAEYEVRANWKIVWENNRECYHCTVNHPQYVKSNFDIYEEERVSARVQHRIEAALGRAETAWQSGGLAISHRQGGLAAFPDAEHNIWYSANRTVLAEGYDSESLDGRRVAPLMGDYRDAATGVLRLRTLPNFWCHASCDHAVTTRLLPVGLHLTRVRVAWLVHEGAREGVDYALESLMPFWQLTSEQDWALCERVQRGVDSRAFQPGPLSSTREYNLEAFLRWYLRQLTPA